MPTGPLSGGPCCRYGNCLQPWVEQQLCHRVECPGLRQMRGAGCQHLCHPCTKGSVLQWVALPTAKEGRHSTAVSPPPSSTLPLHPCPQRCTTLGWRLSAHSPKTPLHLVLYFYFLPSSTLISLSILSAQTKPTFCPGRHCQQKPPPRQPPRQKQFWHRSSREQVGKQHCSAWLQAPPARAQPMLHPTVSSCLQTAVRKGWLQAQGCVCKKGFCAAAAQEGMPHSTTGRREVFLLQQH